MPFFYSALIGAATGTLLTSWLGPRFIAWYFEPPVHLAVTCKDATIWAMEHLRATQFWGAVLGTVLGLTIMIFARHKFKAKNSSQNTEVVKS